jgi:hypothetical protein
MQIETYGLKNKISKTQRLKNKNALNPKNKNYLSEFWQKI